MKFLLVLLTLGLFAFFQDRDGVKVFLSPDVKMSKADSVRWVKEGSKIVNRHGKEFKVIHDTAWNK